MNHAPASDAAAESAATVPTTSPSAFALDVHEVPPLTAQCLIAGVAAAAIQHVALPLLTKSEYRAALTLDKAGAFAANVAAISGMIAFSYALISFVRYTPRVTMYRRLTLASLSGVFLASMLIAVMFERQRTTTEGVVFALGSATLMISLLHGMAFRASRGFVQRLLTLAASLMAAAALATQVLQLSSQWETGVWLLRSLGTARTVGETSFLALLVLTAWLARPTRDGRFAQAGRILGAFVLPATVGGLIAARRALGADYGLVLYHSERVSLWVDRAPDVYAFPLGFALAGALAAIVGGDSSRRQAGSGVLLLLCSGYAPPAPGRMLLFTLGAVLIARAVIALADAGRDASTRAKVQSA